MGIRIGQINAQKSAEAAANLEIIIREKGLDIVSPRALLPQREK